VTVRHVDPPPPPPGLSSAKVVKERTALLEFYADPANATSAYPKGFKGYQTDGVREALTAAFNGKCAYCETNYAAAQPADVEHFRPKGGVTTVGSKPDPPGYWWLASEWLNLLPSCIDCNRPRGQDFPAGIPKTAGKANRFPLGSAFRASAPGQEKQERRLLLHPYFDRPEKHLRFVTDSGTIRDGEIEPVRSPSGRASAKGKASIDVYALQRRGLVLKRQETLHKLLAFLRTIERAKRAAERNPNDALLVDDFRAAVAELKVFLSETGEYSAMCAQVVDEFRAGLF
jgi:uncharacterized protein (TIGR02646 family)